MDKCEHTSCQCDGASCDRAGTRFCGATCADASEAHDLADAICSCGHDACGAATSAV